MANDAPLPSSFDEDSDFYEESRSTKLLRRLREEPLIPLGCFLTCLALVGATRSMRTGDHARTNIMFRRRIYAQGFTLIAAAAGSLYWSGDRNKRKEFEAALAEKKRLERRDKWLKELEARDEEEKAYRARFTKRTESSRKEGGPNTSFGEARSAFEVSREGGILQRIRKLRNQR